MNQSIDVTHIEKMSINKFGLSERRNDDSSQRCSGIVRNYVRENALCRVATDFDARLHKIRRLALPETDTDAANKLFVEQHVETLTNHQKETDERQTLCEKDVQALRTAINELQRIIIKTESETTKEK